MEGNKSRRRKSDRAKKINVFNPKMLLCGNLCTENIDKMIHIMFSFERNDETFVKLKAVNFCSSKFECNCHRNSCNFSIVLGSRRRRRCGEADSFLDGCFTLLILNTQITSLYIILKCFVRQSSFGDDLEYLQRLQRSKK